MVPVRLQLIHLFHARIDALHIIWHYLEESDTLGAHQYLY
jgi:hypothetical protein